MDHTGFDKEICNFKKQRKLRKNLMEYPGKYKYKKKYLALNI